jgi:hypothetical protein
MFEDLPSPLITHSTTLALLKNYARPNDKINHLIKTGNLVRLQREYYLIQNGTKTPLNLIANQLHRPSYVSKEWALQYYGLMTEQVQQITSITIGRSKTIATPVGQFSYHPVPPRYYGVGIESVISNHLGFLIASKEKALCDLLISSRNLRLYSIASMLEYLEEFLRIDTEDLIDFNIQTLEKISQSKYKTTLLNTLLATIQEIQC